MVMSNATLRDRAIHGHVAVVDRLRGDIRHAHAHHSDIHGQGEHLPPIDLLPFPHTSLYVTTQSQHSHRLHPTASIHRIHHSFAQLPGDDPIGSSMVDWNGLPAGAFRLAFPSLFSLLLVHLAVLFAILNAGASSSSIRGEGGGVQCQRGVLVDFVSQLRVALGVVALRSVSPFPVTIRDLLRKESWRCPINCSFVPRSRS